MKYDNKGYPIVTFGKKRKYKLALKNEDNPNEPIIKTITGYRVLGLDSKYDCPQIPIKRNQRTGRQSRLDSIPSPNRNAPSPTKRTILG